MLDVFFMSDGPILETVQGQELLFGSFIGQILNCRSFLISRCIQIRLLHHITNARTVIQS